MECTKGFKQVRKVISQRLETIQGHMCQSQQPHDMIANEVNFLAERRKCQSQQTHYVAVQLLSVVTCRACTIHLFTDTQCWTYLLKIMIAGHPGPDVYHLHYVG